MRFPIGAGLLDACVLSCLEQEDMYGYILTQNVKAVVDISESTLYPVLRRLQKEQFLTTYDMPYGGRNRRYYQITPSGREQLSRLREEWKDYRDRIDQILMGGSSI